MAECRCGCGQQVPKGKKAFVDRTHQYEWMANGGAAQIGALQPAEARAEGGRTAGTLSRDNGRLAQIAEHGRESQARMFDEWQAGRENA